MGLMMGDKAAPTYTAGILKENTLERSLYIALQIISLGAALCPGIPSVWASD
jgi:hypothetical protein